MTQITDETEHWSTTYAYHDAELKSALQKYVRRGMSEMAVACGIEMLRRGNAPFRRLPTIAVEDCAWALTKIDHPPLIKTDRTLIF